MRNHQCWDLFAEGVRIVVSCFWHFLHSENLTWFAYVWNRKESTTLPNSKAMKSFKFFLFPTNVELLLALIDSNRFQIVRMQGWTPKLWEMHYGRPSFTVSRPGGGGGGTQLYGCTHTRDLQVFRTHPKQVLSIGQIYTIFKYFRVLFWQLFCPLNKYNP